METKTQFAGFPKASVQFLKDLKANNERDWFQANKQLYKDSVETPAKAFLVAMTEQLPTLADTDVDGKIFRIYRDVRFAKDKTPYNAHLRISFKPSGGTGSCGEAPAFMFSLEPDRLILGLGLFEFSKDLLPVFQKAIDSDDTGPELERIIKTGQQNDLKFDGPEYKRVPKGFDPDHPRGDLLRLKGLTVWTNLSTVPQEITEHKAVEYCLTQYKSMLPLYRWLRAIK